MWYTGYGDQSKGEQLDCGARFKPDINGYLAASGSKFKSIQVQMPSFAHSMKGNHTWELSQRWWMGHCGPCVAIGIVVTSGRKALEAGDACQSSNPHALASVVLFSPLPSFLPLPRHK